MAEIAETIFSREIHGRCKIPTVTVVRMAYANAGLEIFEIRQKDATLFR